MSWRLCRCLGKHWFGLVLSWLLIEFNSLRPRQNGRLFTDDTFKRIFLNENIRISTKSSLKFVPKGLINNIPALVLIMAWRRPGDKTLSEPMLVRSLTHICVTRPQWVNIPVHRRQAQYMFMVTSVFNRNFAKCWPSSYTYMHIDAHSCPP